MCVSRPTIARNSLPPGAEFQGYPGTLTKLELLLVSLRVSRTLKVLFRAGSPVGSTSLLLSLTGTAQDVRDPVVPTDGAEFKGHLVTNSCNEGLPLRADGEDEFLLFLMAVVPASPRRRKHRPPVVTLVAERTAVGTSRLHIIEQRVSSAGFKGERNYLRRRVVHFVAFYAREMLL